MIQDEIRLTLTINNSVSEKIKTCKQQFLRVQIMCEFYKATKICHFVSVVTSVHGTITLCTKETKGSTQFSSNFGSFATFSFSLVIKELF